VADGLEETLADGAARAPSNVPDTVGRYRIENVLGEGGMGIVYAAFDPDLERRVALKLLSSGEGTELRARLLREARAMARLAHPNVVTVYEVGTHGGRDFVAMELVEGETLKAWIEAGAHSPDEVLDAFLGAGSGLAAAHKAGIVHRDFKPHNVLRRRDGRILVTDFGLARGVEAAPAIAFETTLRPDAKPETKIDTTPSSSLSGLTMTGSVLGTPAYMAPEQWSGAAVGPPADQFAFCVALWEALTGERPFTGPTIEKLREQVQKGARELDASKLPRAVREPLGRGLDPDPAKRWPTMDALLAALRPRRRAPLFVAGGAGLLAIAGAVLVMMRGPGGPTCPAPIVDPAKLGSRGAELAKLRDQACALEPGVRAPRLACLDGALARLELGAAALAIDPAICSRPQPPRLVHTVSPQLREAAVAWAAARDKTPEKADATALLARVGLGPAVPLTGHAETDPCAAAFANMVAFEAGSDTHQHIADADDAAQRCGDDWLRAEVAILALRDAVDATMLGPEVDGRLKTATTLAEVVGDPGVIADLDMVRAEVERIGDKLDDAIATFDRAAAIYSARGRVRDGLRARLGSLRLRELRGIPADLAAQGEALNALRAEAAKQLGDKDDLVREIDGDTANWLYATGHLAEAHAKMMALREPKPPDHAVHASGRVVDADGKPVAGAEVGCSPYLRSDALALVIDSGPSVRVTTTAADGSFEIPDAAADSELIAGLGDQRSAAVRVGEHLTLTLAPTSRIEGKVELGNVAAPRVIVLARLASTSLVHVDYGVVAPVAADGTFSLAGVPRGKIKIAAVLESASGPQLSGVSLDVTDPVVRDVDVTLTQGKRSIDVIVRSTVGLPLPNAQVVVIPGAQPAIIKASELNAQTVSASAKLASHLEGTSPPAGVKKLAKAGDLWATVPEIPDGPASVCAVGLPADLSDPQLQATLMKALDRFEVHCLPVPDTTEPIVVETSPAPRLD
jgi:predicted Ser/Thr protein kinase